MIALTDMRPNLTIAALLLVAGVAYVLFIARRGRRGAKSARWVPWASLTAGPLVGLIFWGVDVYVANPTHYRLRSDATALLGAALLIGAFAECVGALVFGPALHFRHRRGG